MWPAHLRQQMHWAYCKMCFKKDTDTQAQWRLGNKTLSCQMLPSCHRTKLNEKYCAQPFLVSAWKAASGTGVWRWDQHRDAEGTCLRRRSAGGSEGQVWLDSGRAAVAAAGRGFAGLWALQLRLGGLAEPIPQVQTLCWEVQVTLFASQLTQHRAMCVRISVTADCGVICSISATASSMLPGLYGSAGVCGIGTDLHSHNASSRLCFSGYAASSMLCQELQLNVLPWQPLRG